MSLEHFIHNRLSKHLGHHAGLASDRRGRESANAQIEAWRKERVVAHEMGEGVQYDPYPDSLLRSIDADSAIDGEFDGQGNKL